MKGQSEMIIFLLLFIIGIALFTSATFWSKGIFQQNVDIARVENAEKFMKELNDNALNIIKYGGSQDMEYTVDGTIEINSTHNYILEVKVPVTISLPRQWVVISNDSSYIQEMLDGDNFRIQVVYPQSSYKVEFFTEGSRLARPTYLSLERNQTFVSSGTTVIKIKVTFI